MQSNDELYHELILDLYHHPLYKKPLADFTFSHREYNPLCGDEITMFIKVDETKRIVAIGWQGRGCALSEVGSSCVSNYAQGKIFTELEKLTPEFLKNELGLANINPTRLRCLTLALKALEGAFKQKSD